MKHFFQWSGHKIIIALFLQICLSSAECECGYRVRNGGGAPEQSSVLHFMDIVRTDFRVMRTLNESADWKLKNLSLEANLANGRLGREVQERNVVLNPVKDISAGPKSPSVQGSDIDAGLQLIVRSQVFGDNMVGMGEIQSRREDVRFGSFRAYMKTSAINGTCAASFWYHNDSQEIDIELLSRQRGNGRFPVNLSVHSKESVANGFDATNTTGYVNAELGFDPAEKFHEYRYDWSPDAISFYANSKWLGNINTFIPTTGGFFLLSHWSNGFAKWSAGPPTQDATLTVAYFVGYFNSSDPQRVQQYETRCSGNPNSVCDVSQNETPFESSATEHATHTASSIILLFSGLALATLITW